MTPTDEAIYRLFVQSMTARNLTGDTIDNYRRTLDPLAEFLGERGAELGSCEQRHVNAWLASLAERPDLQDTTVATYYRRARAFFRWAHQSELLDGANPMTHIKEPKSSQRVMPIHDAADIAKVVAATKKDTSFYGRRDYAMMMILLCYGTPRAGALASIALDGINLSKAQLKVMDKGRKERIIQLSAEAARALLVYLRARAKHPKAAESDRLFIGRYGDMTRFGVGEMLQYRSAAAGLDKVLNAHGWRHFTMDRWSANGGSVDDAMELYGWSNVAMAHRYARAARARRALDHAAQMPDAM